MKFGVFQAAPSPAGSGLPSLLPPLRATGRTVGETGAESTRRRRIVTASVVAAHLIILALALDLFPHLPPPAVDPDKVMDVFEVSEVPAPLPKEQTPPPESVPIPDPNALAIPVKPDTPVDANSNANPQNASSSEPDYVPQFKLSALPVIDQKDFRSRVIYPPLAAQQGIEATVILLIYTDATGKIRKVSVLKDPGYGFADAAVKALQGMTASPGEINGVPVATQFRQSIPFRLK